MMALWRILRVGAAAAAVSSLLAAGLIGGRRGMNLRGGRDRQTPRRGALTTAAQETLR